jgi:hypothetical protein
MSWMLLTKTPPCFSTILYRSVEIKDRRCWRRRTSHSTQSEWTVVEACVCSSGERRKTPCRTDALEESLPQNPLQKEAYVCFAITFVYVLYVYAHAHLECHPPWRQHRVSYVHVSVNDNANAYQRWHAYWRDVVMKNEFLDILSHVHDTIDICRGEDDEENHNLPPHIMASKITPKTTISQILICRTNILSPITFSRPIGRQPKQRLQLYFHKMQCPRHFFMGSTRHPTLNAMSRSFVYEVQVSPTSAANSTWKWSSWHCQHIICLHGADMSSMCPSLGTMKNHVSCDVT